jgi:type VI protein secretion system component VasK
MLYLQGLLFHLQGGMELRFLLFDLKKRLMDFQRLLHHRLPVYLFLRLK